jgi:cold shock CspA family protein
MRGVIARLVDADKFGFIRAEDGEEYFFHMTALNGVTFEQLDEGVAVDFTPGPPGEGDRPVEHRRAVNVRLPPEEPGAVANEALPEEKLHPERGR